MFLSHDFDYVSGNNPHTCMLKTTSNLNCWNFSLSNVNSFRWKCYCFGMVNFMVTTSGISACTNVSYIISVLPTTNTESEQDI